MPGGEMIAFLIGLAIGALIGAGVVLAFDGTIDDWLEGKRK